MRGPCRGQWGPGAAAGLAPLLETAPPASSSLTHGDIRERKEGKEVRKKKSDWADLGMFLCFV